MSFNASTQHPTYNPVIHNQTSASDSCQALLEQKRCLRVLLSQSCDLLKPTEYTLFGLHSQEILLAHTSSSAVKCKREEVALQCCTSCAHVWVEAWLGACVWDEHTCSIDNGKKSGPLIIAHPQAVQINHTLNQVVPAQQPVIIASPVHCMRPPTVPLCICHLSCGPSARKVGIPWRCAWW